MLQLLKLYSKNRKTKKNKVWYKTWIKIKLKTAEHQFLKATNFYSSFLPGWNVGLRSRRSLRCGHHPTCRLWSDCDQVKKCPVKSVFLNVKVIISRISLIQDWLYFRSWPENYGNRKLQLAASCAEGLRQILQNRKIFLLGCIQTVVESCMYIFVFLWTPGISTQILMLIFLTQNQSCLGRRHTKKNIDSLMIFKPAFSKSLKKIRV